MGSQERREGLRGRCPSPGLSQGLSAGACWEPGPAAGGEEKSRRGGGSADGRTAPPRQAGAAAVPELSLERRPGPEPSQAAPQVAALPPPAATRRFSGGGGPGPGRAAQAGAPLRSSGPCGEGTPEAKHQVPAKEWCRGT